MEQLLNRCVEFISNKDLTFCLNQVKLVLRYTFDNNKRTNFLNYYLIKNIAIDNVVYLLFNR